MVKQTSLVVNDGVNSMNGQPKISQGSSEELPSSGLAQIDGTLPVTNASIVRNDNDNEGDKPSKETMTAQAESSEVVENSVPKMDLHPDFTEKYLLNNEDPEELKKLRGQYKDYEARLSHLEHRRDMVWMILGVLFVISFPFSIWVHRTYHDFYYNQLGFINILPQYLWFIVEAFFIFLIFMVVLVINRPYKRLKLNLKETDEAIQLIRTQTPEGRCSYLEEEARRLTIQIARVFLDNPKRSELANKWREEADRILEAWRMDQEGKRRGFVGSMSDSKPADLGQAETLIGQIKELVLREENEVHQQVLWRIWAIIIMLIYAVGIITAIALMSISYNEKTIIPVIGIPASVILWGAIGSLGAILYRLYSERNRVRLDLEVRWLIARPIIGIIMGALVYLTIMTGMFVFGATSNPPPAGAAGSVPTEGLALYWIVAFLAGFSDKFYKRVIDLLVDKTFIPDNAGATEPDIIPSSVPGTQAV